MVQMNNTYYAKTKSVKSDEEHVLSMPTDTQKLLVWEIECSVFTQLQNSTWLFTEHGTRDLINYKYFLQKTVLDWR